MKRLTLAAAVLAASLLWLATEAAADHRHHRHHGHHRHHHRSGVHVSIGVGGYGYHGSYYRGPYYRDYYAAYPPPPAYYGPAYGYAYPTYVFDCW